MRTGVRRSVTARYTLDRLRVSFWFPSVIMALGGVLLAWAMYWMDGRITNIALAGSRFILSGNSTEIRTMLINMAGTILATAGVVFSLLSLPLSTVAAQYGSRLLRVFLGDRTTQLVLSMFVATFTYCLAAALSIPPAVVTPEGPQLTATVGLLLMLATFGSLVLLIQHISTMLQAPNIAAAAGAELRDVISVEIPIEVLSGDTRDGGLETQTDALLETEGYAVRARRTGYIQYIDPQYMLTLAREHDLVIRLVRKPGHNVWNGVGIALIWPATRVDQELERKIYNAFRVGNGRTPSQDIPYAVNQLVEMAVRAMSPAINDPFTAMTCLDYIGEGLALFIRQGEKGPNYYDLDGKLRLMLEPVTFEELLNTAFDMLRHASYENTSVLMHMLEVMDRISQQTKPSAARQALLGQVDLIRAESQAGDLIEKDQQLIHRNSEALVMKLSGVG
jgi:uncharacterized membrane protein